jgi:hypothetical protein
MKGLIRSSNPVDWQKRAVMRAHALLLSRSHHQVYQQYQDHPQRRLHLED